MVVPLVVMRPYAPYKPTTIALDDYSYTIDYANYMIKDIMKDHKVPSIALALIDDQEIIFQEATGFANIEEGIQATPTTIYRMASIAKVFTAIEVMRLFDEGLIDLDESITTYIPEFTIKSRFPDNSNITIRDLLTHRSGLPRNGNLPYWFWDSGGNVLRDMVRSLKNSHLAFPTGERFKYSNIGFDTLGHVTELFRSDFFAYIMRDQLMRPIGMNQSCFLAQQISSQDDLAVGYSLDNGVNTPLEQSDIIGMPHGNLYASLKDMSEFMRFIFRGGKSGTNQIIANETLQMMYETQPYTTSDTQKLGLGWFTGKLKNSEKVVYHDGGIYGQNSLIAMLPSRKLGVVLMGNSLEFDQSMAVLGWKMLELMLEAKCGITLTDDPSYTQVDVDPSILATYVGKYVVDGDILEFYLEGNKLKVNALGMNLNLKSISSTKFRAEHWLFDIGRIDVEFFKDDPVFGDYIIATLENISRNYGPKYTNFSPEWQTYTGTYIVYASNESTYYNPENLGQLTLSIEDSLLKLSNGFVLKPISTTELLICNSAFLGETMTYDNSTHTLYWSSYRYQLQE